MKRIAALLALCLALGVSHAAAQSQTGTVEGRVVDAQGAVVPGATVSLTGRQGTQTSVSSATGEYRFVGLNPGEYQVKVELAGFATQAANVTVNISKTTQADFSLRIADLSDVVDVTASATTVDATSASTDNTISSELLESMPINIGAFNSATALLNYAPGVNGSSAFGGDASYGNSLLIDGVDTRDPEGGSAWVFYNFNIVEEVQVGGLGATAEYGGFTGAVVNTITKSGGNAFSGLFELRHTNDGLAGKNMPADALKLNPALGKANVLTKLNDFTVQLGGPLKKDKLFWWFSAQRYAIEQDPIGPRLISTEVSPRYNGKLTVQLTPNDTLIGSFQYDNYNVTGRLGMVPSAEATDRQTLRQDSPEAIWNGQYRRVFGSTTFLEAKFTGYWGYYYLDPVDGTSYHFDADTGASSGGAGYIYYADRGRNQVNVSLSRYAEAAGRHNFKFGVEIERSKSKSKFEYSNGMYFVDYSGVPYYAYSTGQYQIEGHNRRESFYAQDAWQAGRLTANLGLRLDRIRGYSPNDDEVVYTPKMSWGPRVGLVFDANGKGTSVIRGFWGKYFEGASFNPWQRATSGYYDNIIYYVDGSSLIEIDRVTPFTYKIDDSIDHLGLDEFNVSFEQQIRRDMRIAVTGIYRDYKNFINSVIPNATWGAASTTNTLTSQPLALYRWVNRASTNQDYLIRNVDGFQYKDVNGGVIATADPKRTYKGFMAVLTKSYSNRWQGQLSYVWSEAKGTVNNSGTASVTGSFFENPNLSLLNANGFMSQDRTHEIKVFAGYRIPRIDVGLNAYYRATSGVPYTADRTVAGSVLNWPGTTTIFLEPRGSRRLDMFQQVDLRLDKSFTVDVHRFSAFVDFQNLFNTATITAVQTRVPSRSISGNTVLFESPTAVQGARQITIGGRWSF